MPEHHDGAICGTASTSFWDRSFSRARAGWHRGPNGAVVAPVLNGAALNGGGRGGDPGAAPGNSPAASDPNGAISLFDALSKQLGLKLEAKKRKIPVLVIDHIEEKPTDN